MNYWDGLARWVNAILLAVVGVIGFDALFRLLEASPDNVVVATVRRATEVLLRPFEGMFGPDEHLLTAFIAVLGYALAGGVILTAVRATQATVRGVTRWRRRVQARRLAERTARAQSAAAAAPWVGAEAEGYDTGPPGPTSALDGRRVDPWEPEEATQVLGPRRPEAGPSPSPDTPQPGAPPHGAATTNGERDDAPADETEPPPGEGHRRRR